MAPRACCRCSRGSSPHKGAWHGGARRTLRGAIGDRGRLAAPRHCHVALNVRGGTFTHGWQCAVHCHSVSIVPQRYAQGRVAVRSVRSGPSGSAAHTATRWRTCGAVRLTLPLGGERAGRYVSHCHSVVNVRGGTFTTEWQCASEWLLRERRGVFLQTGGFLGRSSWLAPCLTKAWRLASPSTSRPLRRQRPCMR